GTRSFCTAPPRGTASRRIPFSANSAQFSQSPPWANFSAPALPAPPTNKTAPAPLCFPSTLPPAIPPESPAPGRHAAVRCARIFPAPAPAPVCTVIHSAESSRRPAETPPLPHNRPQPSSRAAHRSSISQTPGPSAPPNQSQFAANSNLQTHLQEIPADSPSHG